MWRGRDEEKRERYESSLSHIWGRRSREARSFVCRIYKRGDAILFIELGIQSVKILFSWSEKDQLQQIEKLAIDYKEKHLIMP